MPHTCGIIYSHIRSKHCIKLQLTRRVKNVITDHRAIT